MRSWSLVEGNLGKLSAMWVQTTTRKSENLDLAILRNFQNYKPVTSLKFCPLSLNVSSVVSTVIRKRVCLE